MLGYHHPGTYPAMQVTVDADHLGLLEHHRNRAALRLRPIEGAVHRSAAPEVVEQAIAVQELYGPTHRHDHHARDEHTLLLGHLHGRQWRLPPGSGRRILGRHDDVANAPS